MIIPQVNYQRDEYANFDDDFRSSVEPMSATQAYYAKNPESSAAKQATSQCSSIANAITQYKSKMLKESVTKMKTERIKNYNQIELNAELQKKKVKDYIYAETVIFNA